MKPAYYSLKFKIEINVLSLEIYLTKQKKLLPPPQNYSSEGSPVNLLFHCRLEAQSACTVLLEMRHSVVKVFLCVLRVLIPAKPFLLGQQDSIVM